MPLACYFKTSYYGRLILIKKVLTPKESVSSRMNRLIKDVSKRKAKVLLKTYQAAGPVKGVLTAPAPTVAGHPEAGIDSLHGLYKTIPVL
jgi:hypothetical protein